jgi:hypothetical protein
MRMRYTTHTPPRTPMNKCYPRWQRGGQGFDPPRLHPEGLLVQAGSFAGSKLILSTSAGAYEVEFRGADKASAAHDMILTRML